MALREYNYTLGQDKTTIAETGTATAVSGGATDLGGTIGVRLLIDDAQITSKSQMYRALEFLEQRLIEEVWPPA